MKVIRKNVFETNSSSNHVVCITAETELDSGELEAFNIPTNSKGQVAIMFKEFGRGINVLKTQREKLTYLLTYVLCAEGWKKPLSRNDDPVTEFMELEGIQTINTFLRQHCGGLNFKGAEDILILELNFSEDDGTYTLQAENASLDHMSNEGTLREWLEYNNISLPQFILNPGVWVVDGEDGSKGLRSTRTGKTGSGWNEELRETDPKVERILSNLHKITNAYEDMVDRGVKRDAFLETLIDPLLKYFKIGV